MCFTHRYDTFFEIQTIRFIPLLCRSVESTGFLNRIIRIKRGKNLKKFKSNQIKFMVHGRVLHRVSDVYFNIVDDQHV